MSDAPNCYTCTHRRPLMGDCHSSCMAPSAKVVGHPHGIAEGWFMWPYNFDPTWLVSCNQHKKWED